MFFFFRDNYCVVCFLFAFFLAKSCIPTRLLRMLTCPSVHICLRLRALLGRTETKNEMSHVLASDKNKGLVDSSAPLIDAAAGSDGGMIKNDKLTWKHGLIFAAAWLGWGFDFFDLLLFGAVAKPAVTDLLHLDKADSNYQSTIDFWTGMMSSLSLIGWGFGGVLFGFVADRWGRSRTLLLTVLTYCGATALCAAAPNIWLLAIFRFLVGMGVGGEAGAGATLVAETFPERYRLFFSLMLFTAASVFSFLSTIVSNAFPDNEWRYPFLVGLVPAAVTIVLRSQVEEPEAWAKQANPYTDSALQTSGYGGADVTAAGGGGGGGAAVPVQPLTSASLTPAVSFKLLFAPKYRRRTMSGLVTCTVTLVGYWVFGSFMIPISDQMAREANSTDNETWWEDATSLVTNVVGILVVFPMIPAFHVMRRLTILKIIFAGAAISTFIVLFVDWAPLARLWLMSIMALFVQAGFPVFPVRKYPHTTHHTPSFLLLSSLHPAD